MHKRILSFAMVAAITAIAQLSFAQTITVKYFVENTTSAVKLYNASSTFDAQISSMTIDGTPVDKTASKQFATIGEHVASVHN